MFDLKDFRKNKLKMTQTDFARLIGIRQDSVSRLEQSSEQISLDILVKIAKATGTTLDELVNYKRINPRPLQVEDTWKNANFTKCSIVDYIDDKLKKYKEYWKNNYYKYISELRENIEKIISKPKIAIVGHSDTGKSRLINSIIGSENMPTSWTPTTSIIIYIKHINDRPSYIEEDVWVFRESVDNVVGWDDKKLSDEEYCRKWKLSSGGADILKNYGTRQGDMYAEGEAGSAVIFVESDILKNCDLIDLPGFGTGDRVEDDTMTIKAKKFADVLIYMSHAGQFLRGEEIEYLKETINSLNIIENRNHNSLKPLSNLFIVASHAHTVDGGNVNSLNNILDSGCNRFFKTLPKGYFMYRSNISGYTYDFDVVRNRFFTYTTDIENLRKPFESELKSLVEILPEIINNKAKTFISDYIKSTGINMDKEIKEYTNIINERNKYDEILKEIESNESEREKYNRERRKNLIFNIKTMKESSVSRFIDFYNKTIDVDKIIEIIDEREFKKKKEDIQLLGSYINSTLQGGMQEILKDESEKLKEEIDKYVSDFEESIKADKFSIEFPDIDFSFNATRAFASGLAGLATLGGLALWASTLGNLGAYILVAKGVSLLSALGISVGGTAAGISAVAAIGGPAILGIAIAVIAAISIFAVLSGGWKKSISKKIVNTYNSKKVLEKFKESIEKFYLDTEDAFNAAADSLENEWKEYVSNLKELVLNCNINEIQNRISKAKEFKNFIQGIPL